jgi:long-chain fatty acid transport protein
VTQRKSLCAAAVALALVSGSAFATNGYFSHGYGTKNKGMAGAGVALPQDAMAAATNPAGMAHVGDRLDVGAAVFAPYRSYHISDKGGSGFPEDVDSEREMFLVPHFAYNKMLDADSSVGVAVYGNGGMNSFYRDSDTLGGAGTFGGGNAGVDLMQLFVAPTYARNLNSNVSVGVSAILAYQRFKAHGLSPAFDAMSSDPTKLSNNNYDDSYGIGAKIGIQAELNNMVSVGASYQSKVYMSEFDKYAGLFAEQGDFDIPANFTVGLAIKPSKDVTVVADVQRIMYSDVASIANPGTGLGGPLGADNGPGFGWDDITVYKLGVQWAYSSDLTLRAGFSHTDAPMGPSEVTFNILAPAVVENHFTLGATKQLDKGSEVSVSAMYAPEGSVSGVGMLGPTELNMHQFELEASYGMTW